MLLQSCKHFWKATDTAFNEGSIYPKEHSELLGSEIKEIEEHEFLNKELKIAVLKIIYYYCKLIQIKNFYLW